ncbi:MAG: hypothetical protein ACW981_05985 [Candidatus Hodarchaeales archaeon]|jgi:hypothetical protein
MILKVLGISVKDKDEEIHLIIGALTLLVVALFGLSIYYYADSFNLLTNYLSDLGRDSVGGNANTIAAFLFKLAMFVGGISLLVFFLVSPEPLGEIKSNFKLLVIIGELVGIVASIVMPLIGLVPVDVDLELHNTIGWIFFATISIAIVSYSVFFFISFLENRDQNSDLLIFILIRFAGLILVVLLLELLTEFLGILSVPIDLLIISLLLLFVIIIILFLIARTKVKAIVGFISYCSSLFMVGLIVIIIYFIYSTGLEPYIEIILVSAIIVWAFISNARAFFLSLETN